MEGVSRVYAADLAGAPEKYTRFITEFSPDEIYNLAAISSHRMITEKPAEAFAVNALAPVAMLSEISKMGKKPRFLQASTAYIFEGMEGKVDEKSVPCPTGTYGISKLASHLMVKHFCSQGLFACNAILFNHESPRRGTDFVTRKITRAAAEFSKGKRSEPLLLGNLDSQRDWGFAGDYVEAMWLMLQQAKPDDYVIATGESHSVHDFCEAAFSHVGLGWKEYVKTDSSLVRKSETRLQASTGKARKELGWAPKVKFKELVHMMVDADMH